MFYSAMNLQKRLIMHHGRPKAGHRKSRWTSEAKQGASMLHTLLSWSGIYNVLLLVTTTCLLQLVITTGYYTMNCTYKVRNTEATFWGNLIYVEVYCT